MRLKYFTIQKEKCQEEFRGFSCLFSTNLLYCLTQANCPDHYCEKRGFCAGGTDIVCLPNRLVIHFLGAQTVDAQAG